LQQGIAIFSKFFKKKTGGKEIPAVGRGVDQLVKPKLTVLLCGIVDSLHHLGRNDNGVDVRRQLLAGADAAQEFFVNFMGIQYVQDGKNIPSTASVMVLVCSGIFFSALSILHMMH
jgi:hypothetical protein